MYCDYGYDSDYGSGLLGGAFTPEGLLKAPLTRLYKKLRNTPLEARSTQKYENDLAKFQAAAEKATSGGVNVSQHLANVEALLKRNKDYSGFGPSENLSKFIGATPPSISEDYIQQKLSKKKKSALQKSAEAIAKVLILRDRGIIEGTIKLNPNRLSGDMINMMMTYINDYKAYKRGELIKTREKAKQYRLAHPRPKSDGTKLKGRRPIEISDYEGSGLFY